MVKRKDFQDIEELYDLEIENILKKIKEKKHKKILLQFPDGLKPYALSIVDRLEELSQDFKPKPMFLIWMGSCFGACDIPQLDVIKKQIDLLVQFGHSSWSDTS
jgi:2-(3-amino-3-carboxypropyl)histidine synthase